MDHGLLATPQTGNRTNKPRVCSLPEVNCINRLVPYVVPVADMFDVFDRLALLSRIYPIDSAESPPLHTRHDLIHMQVIHGSSILFRPKFSL